MNISPLEFALTGFTALVCAVFAFAALVDVKLLTSTGGEHKFAAWRQLGVPDILARPATLVFQILWHLLLAISLALTTGVFHSLMGTVAALTCWFYLLVVVRAWREQRSCGCFHEDDPAAKRDLARAMALALAATFIAWCSWQGHFAWSALWGQPAAAVGIMVAVVFALVVGVSLAPARTAAKLPGARGELEGVGAAGGTDAVDEDDYQRSPIPHVFVLRGEEEVSLLHLANQAAALVFYLSGSCSSCVEIRQLLPQFQKRLPQLRFYVLSSEESEAMDLPAGVEQFFDRNRVVWWLLGMMTPSVMLISPDGMISGGPVRGVKAVQDFIDDVEAELLQVRAAYGTAETESSPGK